MRIAEPEAFVVVVVVYDLNIDRRRTSSCARLWHTFAGELSIMEDRSVVRNGSSRACHTCTRRSGPNKQKEERTEQADREASRSRLWHGFGGELADFGEPRGAVRIEVGLWWIV
jgi:hypothetical protein